MKKASVLVALLFLSAMTAWAQRSPDFCKKFSDANFHLENRNYSEAINAYEELVKQEPNNALLNYNLGFCILEAGTLSKADALPFLEEAEKNMIRAAVNYDDLDCNEKRAPLSTLMNLGDALLFNNQFEKAAEKLQKYKDLEKKMDKETAEDLDLKIAMCRFAATAMKSPVKCEIVNAGDSINTKWPDYAAVVTDDESTLFFNSRRDADGNFSGMDGRFNQTAYRSDKSGDNYGTAYMIGVPVNEEENDAITAISADGTKMLVSKDQKENGNLYMFELKGDSWSPVDLGPSINTKFVERAGAFSADCNTIYFSSDRKGGKGGFDIYRSVKNGNVWGPAENLGDVINTKYDEVNPQISFDGKTMFFASNGHTSMGGFDLLKSSSTNGNWSAPENLGYPINTVDDDLNYIESLDGRKAWVSQNRKGGKGDLDIYQINYTDRKPLNVTVYMGKVVLNNGVKELTNTNKISVKGSDGSNKTFKAGANGKFSFTLKPGAKYSIAFEANGKQFYSDELNIPAGTAYQEIKREINIDPELARIKDEERKAEEQAKIEAQKQNNAAKPIGFKMNFKYNKKDISASNDFNDFLKQFEAAIKAGPVVVNTEACASKVPTRKYKNNEALSALRAQSAKDKLIEIMKTRKWDASKVTFSQPKALVGGPEYKNDWNESRDNYEKFQYIDISVDKK
jgi:outer membrane protein OmpA-like peptidoglycan-associated protein